MIARTVMTLAVWCFSTGMSWADPQAGLVGHWKLAGDCRDDSGHDNHGVNHGADLGAGGARFDGIDDFIEVPGVKALGPDKKDFSIALWVHTEAELTDVLGDILSKYDPATRTGVNLSIINSAGVTSSQANYRNLSFGIDAGRTDAAWKDCGRPGRALYVMALAVFDGRLYAGTYEEGEKEAGHVYCYDRDAAWIDCGSPDKANAVGSLAVYQGKLYAGSARYNAEGSALAKSRNWLPGGRVYRFEGGKQWTDCGRLGEANEVIGMAVFGGKLYASPLYQDGKGLYRYDGEKRWAYCGNPGRRIQPLAVYNGALYAGSYDYGRFVRFDGPSQWTDLGQVPDTTQVYSFAVYQGMLHVCTWPNGEVFAYDPRGKRWTSVGRLGKEKEVMGVAVYNGKMYAGTLPLGAVFRFDGPNRWTLTGQLDTTPNVTYRRVWSMAVYQGRLFAGTLPSGRVFSWSAGACATCDRELAPGWRHVAAVKAGGSLKLYVDGRCAASSSPFDPAGYDLSVPAPLKIGFGQHDYFNGRMRDLRLYQRALGDEEICTLATRSEIQPAERRRFLAIDNGKNRLLYIDEHNPAKSWATSIPAGSRDLQLLDHGRVLVSHGNGAAEYDLATGRKLEWAVDRYSQVNSAQRLANGATILGANTQAGVQLYELDRGAKQTGTRFLPGLKDLRLLRSLDGGNLLMTVSDPCRAVEVDPSGKIVWQAPLPGKGYKAIRLPGGNTVVSTGGDVQVIELDPKAQVLRAFGGKQAHPGLGLDWFSGFDRLPNGNIVVANWLGHGKLGTGPHLVEFDRSNRAIWKWEDHQRAAAVTNVLVLNP